MANVEEIRNKLSEFLGEIPLKRMMDLIDRKDKCVIDWDKVIPLTAKEITDYNSIDVPSSEDIAQAMKKIAIVCGFLVFICVSLCCHFLLYF